MSNRGFFGPGNFTDHSTLDVLPALAVGALLAALVVGLAVARLLANRIYAPAWLRESAVEFGRPSLRTTVPLSFALQMAVLFAMETIEQIVVWGHPLGPATWLGGPIAASLLLHFVANLGVAWLFARVLRLCAKTIAQVVRIVMQAFRIARGRNPILRVRAESAAPVRFIEPIIARLQGRAPPQPAVA